MPVPNDIVHIPDLEECCEAIGRAVQIKIISNPNEKITTSKYLTFVGFDKNLDKP